MLDTSVSFLAEFLDCKSVFRTAVAGRLVHSKLIQLISSQNSAVVDRFGNICSGFGTSVAKQPRPCGSFRPTHMTHFPGKGSFDFGKPEKENTARHSLMFILLTQTPPTEPLHSTRFQGTNNTESPSVSINHQEPASKARLRNGATSSLLGANTNGSGSGLANGGSGAGQRLAPLEAALQGLVQDLDVAAAERDFESMLQLLQLGGDAVALVDRDAAVLAAEVSEVVQSDVEYVLHGEMAPPAWV